MIIMDFFINLLVAKNWQLTTKNMLDIKNFGLALDQLAEEKGISKEKIVETIEMALAAAYKKDYGEKPQVIRAKFDLKTGHAEFWQIKTVVDETVIKSEEEIAEEEAARAAANQAPLAHGGDFSYEEENEDGTIVKKVRFNDERHIMIKDAKKIKKDAKVGDEISFPLETKDDYGRIAAQTAKQVILQRLREAERDSLYEEFASKEGEVVGAIVQRVEGKMVFLDIGRGVGVLPFDEQVRGERYRIGERIKVLVLRVDKGNRGPGIYLSRSHPRLVSKMFEIEVPEIAAGTVEIKSISREAGSRTKIAVASNQEGVDPVGSCVGQKGTRVTTVISELGGEKIDIIPWSENLSDFISASLSPAKALDVDINEEAHSARVTVAEDQLSLAIGRGGQNVRLAAKLTGYKIDIQSRTGETVAEATTEGEVSGTGIVVE